MSGPGETDGTGNDASSETDSSNDASNGGWDDGAANEQGANDDSE